MLSRRAFVGKLAAGAAVACAAGIGRAEAMSARANLDAPTGSGSGDTALGPMPQNTEVKSQQATEPSSPAPWELLRPLTLGSAVAHGWRVAELSDVTDGSCVLTLRDQRGRTHRVHLCRNDGRPQGLVHTNRFDLVVMNGGQGDLPTEEGLAQAVAEVAHVVAANEGEHESVAAALLPHAQRVSLFASAAKLR